MAWRIYPQSRPFTFCSRACKKAVEWSPGKQFWQIVANVAVLPYFCTIWVFNAKARKIGGGTDSETGWCCVFVWATQLELKVAGCILFA